MKLVGVVSALIVWLAAPRAAHAQGIEPVCEASYVGGQRAYKLKHDLLAGREQLLVCARACPDQLRASCGRWLGEIERALPSIVVKAKDAAGHDVLDVTIEIDGKPPPGYTDGAAIDLNPGEHAVRVERAGRPAVEDTVLVQAGEKLRVVEVWLEPRAVGSRRPVPVAAFVLAGVSAVSLASFGVFSIWTTVEYDSTSSCNGRCAPSSRDSSFTTKTVLADASLGVAAASFVAASVVYLARPIAKDTTAPTAGLMGPWAMAHGAGVGWVMRF